MNKAIVALCKALGQILLAQDAAYYDQATNALIVALADYVRENDK